MSAGNQLFILWHGGLSTTLTAAKVALRLGTSMDGCVSHVYSVTPCKPNSSFSSAQQPPTCYQEHLKQINTDSYATFLCYYFFHLTIKH